MNLTVARIRIDGAALLGRAWRGNQSAPGGRISSAGIFEFYRELRVNRLRTAERAQQRDFAPVHELLQKWMLAPEVAIHTVLRLAWNDLAVIARHCPAVRIIRDVNQVGRLRERLIQIYRVVDHGKIGHTFTVPDEMLHDGRLIALGQAVCAILSSFYV